ncbi:MAG: histidine phosphatase family protein, partial [Ktedonobacteraceae bacterium]|nr:histidine phosphatase family protein [Ktedonobacteraceae bacterium]
MRLIVVRHGETLYNMQDRLTGQSDIPLSPPGERQAVSVGTYLANEKLDCIVSSDLQRARATALAIATHHELPVEEDPDIREIAFGSWEGMLLSEIATAEPELLALWRINSSSFAPPGGETPAQLHTRVARALDRWYARYPDGNIVWVTHGGLLGVLTCHLLAIDINHRRQFHFDNASVSEFLYGGERMRIFCLNETAFL